VTVSVSLAIPHASWIPERVAALKRLEDALGIPSPQWIPITPVATLQRYRLFTDRTTHWVWSDKAWKWSIAQDVSHCLFLTDDVLVAPGFWLLLRAMVQAKPDVAIGLMSPLPNGPEVVRAGKHGYTIGAGLTGPGYLLPRAMLREFVEWRGKQSWDFVSYWNEDSLLNVWLTETGRRSWHPCPTIADHDIGLGSSVGHHLGPMSRPSVLWTGECPFTDSRFPPFDLQAMERVEFWQTDAPALTWPPVPGPPSVCAECRSAAECRPYGPGGAPVCHSCAIRCFEHRLRGPQA
jgi:hypothetical protein